LKEACRRSYTWHGGEFALGAPEMADDANRQLTCALGSAVFSVDQA